MQKLMMTIGATALAVTLYRINVRPFRLTPRS